MSQKPLSLYTTTFWFGFAYNFFMGFIISNNMIYPLFIELEGGNPDHIGLFMAVFFAAAAFLRPIIGSLIDRWGAKNIMMISTMLMSLPCIGFYYLINQNLHPLIWPLRFLQGVGWGAHMSAFLTMAAQMAPEGRKNEAISMYSISGMTANLMGPLLGEIIAVHYGIGNFFMMMLFVGFSAFLFAAFSKFPNIKGNRSPLLNFPGMKFILFSTQFQVLFIVAMCFSISYTTIVSFIAPIMNERGVTSYGLFFTGFAVSGITIRLIGSQWGDRYGFITILGPSLSFYGMGLLILQFSHSLHFVIIAGIVSGIAHGLAFPLITAICDEISPNHLRGTAIAITTGIMDVSNIAAAFTLGLIGTYSGYGYLFLLGAIAPFVSTLLVIISGSILLPEQEAVN